MNDSYMTLYVPIVNQNECSYAPGSIADQVMEVWSSIKFRGLLKLMQPTALVVTYMAPDASSNHVKFIKVSVQRPIPVELFKEDEDAPRVVVAEALSWIMKHELDEATPTSQGWLINNPDMDHV